MVGALLLAGCAGAPAAAPPAQRPEPARFPLFAGAVDRPVWLERAAVKSNGDPMVKGPTRANMDAVTLPFTDLPLMSDAEPCDRPCKRFDIPVTRRDGRGRVTAGPGGVRTLESSRTLDSPDGQHRAVEWWVLDQDPSRPTLGVTRVVGLFDPGTRLPIGYTRAHADAAPVEAGVLFVFRTCDEGCDRFVGDPLRVEHVTLIGPSGSWTASSDDPLQPSQEEEFTRVSAHVRAGTAESVTLNYDTLDAKRFARRDGDDGSAGGIETVMLDVVWASGEVPELTLHRGFFVDGRDAPDLRLPEIGAR
ncbi:MAG: hypothetical protein U0414_30865 [Polyangiaceae bacterium]